MGVQIGDLFFNTPMQGGLYFESVSKSIRFAGLAVTGISMTAISSIFNEAFVIPVASNTKQVTILGVYIRALFNDSSASSITDVTDIVQLRIDNSVNSGGNVGLHFNSNQGQEMNLIVDLDSTNSVNARVVVHGGSILKSANITPAAGDTMDVIANIKYLA